MTHVKVGESELPLFWKINPKWGSTIYIHVVIGNGSSKYFMCNCVQWIEKTY